MKSLLLRPGLVRTTSRLILYGNNSPCSLLKSTSPIINQRNKQSLIHHQQVAALSSASYFKSAYPDISAPNVGLNEFIFKEFHKWENRDALIDGKTGEKLTFGQIVEDVHSLSINLSEQFGVSKGDCVGVFAPNHVNYFTVLAAIAQTGAHSSPVNPLSPADALAAQLATSGAKLLIAHSATAAAAAEAAERLGLPVLLMDGNLAPLLRRGAAGGGRHPHPHPRRYEGRAAAAAAAGAPLVPLDYREDLWTLPYSSGTTGLPKGTMLTHQNLVSNLLQLEPADGVFVTPEERLITPLPFFHIYGMVVSLMHHLRKGSPIIFLPAFDLELFLKLIQDHKATRAHAVPPVVLALAKSPAVDRYDLSSLRAVVSAAAPLDGAIEGRAAERCGCIVKQAWGMTELSPVGTMVPDNHLKPLSGTVGVLCPSTEGKVVDPETGDVVPVGEEGELHIRGPQVMKGYRGNAGATAACLSVDGWLCTGDVARFDAEGYLYITERVKELIKYKGFQVPPAELEACLLGHPGVQDALVIGVPHEEAGEVPRAYVVLKDPGAHTAAEIQDYVASRVSPIKKLRGGIEFRSSIPKSASGKLLRRVVREELAKSSSTAQHQ